MQIVYFAVLPVLFQPAALQAHDVAVYVIFERLIVVACIVAEVITLSIGGIGHAVEAVVDKLVSTPLLISCIFPCEAADIAVVAWGAG